MIQPPSPVIEASEPRFVDPGGVKLLIAVLTCDKYEHRAAGIRKSWLKLAPSNYRVLFVHGRPGQPEGIEGDRLYLDCPESYEMLPRKIRALLNYSLRHFDFDYLFKTDDDTYLDLERFIAFDKKEADYIGEFSKPPILDIDIDICRTWHVGKCADKAYEVPYARPYVCEWATGGGYFLSHRAVEIAAAKIEDTFAGNLFEDVMIGEALTLDPEVEVLRTRYGAMGVINPLLPKDMWYVQRLLLEKRALAEEVFALRRQSRELSMIGGPQQDGAHEG